MKNTQHTKIRIAIIGAGLIRPRHAQSVLQNSETELSAIVDPAPSGTSLAGELKLPHFATVNELLESEHKPDAAIICTPNHLHVPIARTLSSSGVHILVEKPVSADIKSGKELLDHLRSTKVKAIVGHHRRFHPCMISTKEILSSQELGQLIAINGLWALHKPSTYFSPPTEWRKTTTGGVVLINMVHEIDLLHYLFGPITRVHAEKTISQRGHEAEEGAALTFRFKSGLVGSFLLSDSVPSPYNFEAGTGENPLIPKTGQDFYRIFGTKGCLSVPDMSIWSYKDGEKSWYSNLTCETFPVTDTTIPFDGQLDHFCRVIRGEEPPSCTAQAGLAALIVCNAIRDSLATDKTVKIEPYELQ